MGMLLPGLQLSVRQAAARFGARRAHAPRGHDVLHLSVHLLSGFWLNRHVAFRRSPLPRGTQLFRYLLSVLGSVVVNYLCLKLFVDVCGFWATPSQMLASLITMVYSYLAAKYFTFRHAAEE